MAIQHGFTVQPSGNQALDILQKRIKKALDTLAAGATASQLTDNKTYITVGAQNIQNDARGPDLPSGSVIAPTAAYHDVSGSVACNYLAIGGTFDGFRVELALLSGVTFNHAAGAAPAGAYALHTLTGAPVVKAGGTVIAFRRVDSLRNWIQVA